MAAKGQRVSGGLLTVEDCAERLRCSVTTVEGFIRDGRLARVQLSAREVGSGRSGPKLWRVRPETLERFIEAMEGYEPQRDKPTDPNPAVRPPSLPVATGRDGKVRLRTPRPSRR